VTPCQYLVQSHVEGVVTQKQLMRQLQVTLSRWSVLDLLCRIRPDVEVELVEPVHRTVWCQCHPFLGLVPACGQIRDVR